MHVYLGIYNNNCQSLILKASFVCFYRFTSMKYMQYTGIKNIDYRNSYVNGQVHS